MRRLPVHPALLEAQEIALKNCIRCGNCCRENPEVELHEDELWRIARHLGIPKAEAKARYTMRGDNNRLLLKKPCPFLQPGACYVYEVRPQVCRDFPFLSDVCRIAAEKDKRLQGFYYCRASLIALSTIEVRAEKERKRKGGPL